MIDLFLNETFVYHSILKEDGFEGHASCMLDVQFNSPLLFVD